MPDSRTILLLGGSAQQLPVIYAARAMGLRTVLIDYLDDNPGRLVADRWYSDSTTDINAIERIARAENVSGILAYASDPAALPAAVIADRLGLPGNPPEAVETLGMKHRFRRFLSDNGFNSPQTVIFSPDTPGHNLRSIASNLTYPIIVKPTDVSGSRGVSLLYSDRELAEAAALAASYSRNRILIAEEYIERGFPYVIGGDIFVENGNIVLFGLMQCLRGDSGQSLLPIGEQFPSTAPPRQMEAIRTELQHIVELLGIRTGELNIEVLIGTDNRPHFLEVGPRAGGNMIPVQLSDAFGCDLITANVRAAMGLPVCLSPKNPEGVWMTYVLHSPASGIFAGVDVSPELEPFIYRRCHYLTPGQKIDAFDHSGKAAGIYFLHFNSSKIPSDLENGIRVRLYNDINTLRQ